MRSAKSRLGLVSSLGSARRGVGRCVDAVPVSARAVKLGGAALAGLAGAVVLRSLLPRRRRAAALPAPVPAPVSRPAVPRHALGRVLLTESVVTLLLPLCRHYLLGEKTPVSDRLCPLIDRLFKKGRP